MAAANGSVFRGQVLQGLLVTEFELEWAGGVCGLNNGGSGWQ